MLCYCFSMDTNKKLLKLVKKVGSMSELARLLGVSRGYVNNMIKQRKAISPKLVKELVFLSDGELTEEELRPDVFYNPKDKKNKKNSRI